MKSFFSTRPALGIRSIAGLGIVAALLSTIVFALSLAFFSVNGIPEAYATDYIITDEASCLALPGGSPSWDGTTHSCEINGVLTISSDDGVGISSGTKLVVKPSGEINNSGLIRNDQSLITNHGVIINYGTIEQLFFGELDNYGSLTNAGTIRNLQAPPSINNYGSLTNTGTLFQGTITNDAAGNIINSGVIASWFLFNNYGTITNYETIDSTQNPDSPFNNYGTINNIATFRNEATLNNHGIITNDGELINQGADTGTITNYPDGTIENKNTFTNFGSLANSGTITNYPDGLIDNFFVFSDVENDGTVINYGTVTSSGNVINSASGNLENYGVIVFKDGFIANSGEITVANTGSDSIGITNSASISNSGTIIVANTGSNSIGIKNLEDGSISNSGTLTVANSDDGGVGHQNWGISNFGTINNAATINLQNTLSVGILNDPVGSITNSGTINVANNDGSGIANNGAFANNHPGTLNIQNTGGFGLGVGGSFTNTGTVTVSNIGGVGIENPSRNFSNSGTITVANTGGGVGIFNTPGSLLTNSGTMTVENGGTIRNSGTIENSGTINNNCGTFTNEGTLTGNPVNDVCDSDKDGIVDIVDTQPNTFSNDFSDVGIGGTTTGKIISRGDQTLTILDASNPDGVRIKTDPSGSGDKAKISACGGSATHSLSAGKEITVTCSSVTTQVIQGPVEVELFGADGSTASVTLETGFILTFDPETNSFIADPNNPGSITITTGGNTVTVDPGETVQQLSVTIDIKPGGTPNTINLKSDKTVTVALLGSATFNVNSVDKSTLKFGPTLQAPIKTSLQDVNKDSFMDLVSQYKVPPLGFKTTDTQGCLTGLLQDGTPFRGCDSVKILNK
jgi:hypothetical protein